MSGRQRKDRAAWQAYVRSHPVRRAILALYEQNEGRSLAAEDLLRELGETKTTYAVVAYHVRVLKDAGLLPGSKLPPPCSRFRR
jgi:Helix-turn-helix domain